MRMNRSIRSHSIAWIAVFVLLGVVFTSMVQAGQFGYSADRPLTLPNQGNLRALSIENGMAKYTYDQGFILAWATDKQDIIYFSPLRKKEMVAMGKK